MISQCKHLIASCCLGILLVGCAGSGGIDADREATRPVTLEALRLAAAQANLVLETPAWETTPEQIDASVKEAIAEAERALDAIATRTTANATFRNTIAALEHAYIPVAGASRRVSTIRQTSTDPAMREKAHEAGKQLSAWFVKTSFREDLYRAVKAYASTGPVLDEEDARLLEETLRGYRRNGMELAKAQQQELERLKTELNDMGMEFRRNINQANDSVVFTAAELDGVSGDILENDTLKTEDGDYRINSNVTWQYMTVMQNARSGETRRRLDTARYNRAREANVPLFTRILKHRAKIAEILGYAHWADYRIEPKMAQTAATAYRFEEELVAGLEEKFREEQEELRRLKAEMTGDPDAVLQSWDRRYYRHQLKKRRYDIDADALKVYFELNRVLDGMFGIFEELFGIAIREVEPDYRWIEDLRLFAVSDTASGAPLGLVYMDMFPREGKYNHFAVFGITSGKRLPDGRYQRPVVALVCNFPPPGSGKPSLLKHDQVETLFHEFGHALHGVLTQAEYASFSGTSVPRDFVEAPSQMLEHWVWDKAVLDRFAADYRDPTKKIPADFIQRMEAAKLAGIATFYRGQLSLGMMDLGLHMTREEAVFDNAVEFSNRILSQISTPVLEESAFIAAFGHLGGGYDAGYYGYIWADAIAEDMASVFRESSRGLMDPEIGMRLRNEIYARGDSREIETSIQAFLGRERSLQPFLRNIGINETATQTAPAGH